MILIAPQFILIKAVISSLEILVTSKDMTVFSTSILQFLFLYPLDINNHICIKSL